MLKFFKALFPKNNGAKEAVDASGMVHAHAQSRILHETIYYPTHPARGGESSEFEETKKALIEAGVGCGICGVLNTPEAPLEGHHAIAELAMQNATDFLKIKKDFPETTASDASTFIDSPNGIILLCAKHHRAPMVGIHMITFPAWIFQRYADDNWNLVNGPNMAAMPMIEDDTWYPKH